jgi:hypothetical protein
MTDESITDPLAPPNPKWVSWSTRESIEQHCPSITAIVETLVAVPLYWWLAIHFETYGFLIFSAFVAPLVLLRSNESVLLGVKWATKWETFEQEEHWNELPRGKKAFALAVALIAILGSTVAAHTFGAAYLVYQEDSTAFVQGFAIAVGTGLAAETLTVAGGVATAGMGVAIIEVALVGGVIGAIAGAGAITAAGVGPSALAGVGVGAAAVAAVGVGSIAGMRAAAIGPAISLIISIPQLFVGYGIGIFIVTLAIRIAATLRHFLSGFFSIAQNFHILAFCTSPAQLPELVPGLPETSELTLTGMVKLIDENLRSANWLRAIWIAGPIIVTILCFVPAWLYRITLKSTVWVWWPLAFIGNTPKLANTPAWQYKAMVGTLIGWAAIISASYTDAIFLLMKFISRAWREGLPENPFLTSLRYFFALNWSGQFWPIFSIVGPTLSIVTLVWLNRTFAKYQTATEHKYEELQQEAELTFPVIERVQRVQYVLFILYCLLVVGQAALYLNS